MWCVHDSNQWCRQQAKCTTLRCWASRWAQHGGYEQSKSYEIVCQVKRLCHWPLLFENVKVTSESSWNMIILHAFSSVKLLEEDYIFKRTALIRTVQTSLQLTWATSIQKLDFEGLTSCFFSTLSPSDCSLFLFVGPYKNKDKFYTHRLTEAPNRIRAEMGLIGRNVWILFTVNQN